jgi:hypothetical protein
MATEDLIAVAGVALFAAIIIVAALLLMGPTGF